VQEPISKHQIIELRVHSGSRCYSTSNFCSSHFNSYFCKALSVVRGHRLGDLKRIDSPKRKCNHVDTLTEFYSYFWVPFLPWYHSWGISQVRISIGGLTVKTERFRALSHYLQANSGRASWNRRLRPPRTFEFIILHDFTFGLYETYQV
jgi:hypothetical protein